jgi:aryl-alcohol dehydrogenase-like predicted oxidoreductase
MTFADRSIGTLSVSPIGLGGARWSMAPGANFEDGIAALNAGVDAGITFVDTALRYTIANEENHNERLIAGAVAKHGWQSDTKPSEIVIATKGGHFGAGRIGQYDTSPQAIKAHCESSLQALGVDSIDLYYLHWPREEEVSISETMKAFEDLRQEGKIKNVGVSNFDKRQLDEALSVAQVKAVQNHFNPSHQPVEEHELIAYTQSLGIAYVPYSPLGGTFPPSPLTVKSPRLEELAKSLGVTVAVLILDWHLNLSPNIIPLVGSTRAQSVIESAKVLSVDVPLEVTQEVAKIYREN